MTQEETRFCKQDVKSNLDELFSSVANFRNTESFQQMLDFVSRFRSLSPYNAFLIYQQCPGVKYVLNAASWYRHFKRKIKPDARPLIILVPFGPVDFVYDISDTYPVKDKVQPSLFDESDEEFLSSISEPYKTSGYVPKKELIKLVDSMKYHGIGVDWNLRVGGEYAGKIRLLSEYCSKLEIEYKKVHFDINANYLLSIRENAGCGEAFATAVHELGHLFCHHLTAAPDNAWIKRGLDHAAKEFEAESVSFIICSRYGVDSPSARYLNGYYEQNKTIPNISVENIFTACNMILNMINGITVKQGILYKHDDYFRKLVDSIKRD